MRQLPRAMCAAFCAPSRRASEGERVSGSLALALALALWRVMIYMMRLAYGNRHSRCH
jgi:hypothetical protein